MTSETVDLQAALFMGFPREEFCSGLLFPSPRDSPNPGVEPASLALASIFCTREVPPAIYHPFHEAISLENTVNTSQGGSENTVYAPPFLTELRLTSYSLPT